MMESIDPRDCVVEIPPIVLEGPCAGLGGP